MKKTLNLKVEHEALTLMTDSAYSRVVSWFGSTMRDLKMDLILPKNRMMGHAPCPAILWLCGGAYKEVNRSVWLPQLVDLAQRGYVIASAEYRTSNEQGFPAALEDAKAAVRFLKANAADFFVDPDRICVMGESAGGTLASLVGVTGGIREFDVGANLEYSSSVDAAVDYYGIVKMDLQKKVSPQADCAVPGWCMEAFLGADWKEAERAEAVNYVNENTPPFLIFHGDCDPLVPIANSELFYEILTENGCDAEFYTIAGAVHGDDLFYQKGVMDIVDNFLKRVFKNK